MTHVFERHVLHCPYVRARQYLRESLEAAAADGSIHTLPLTATLSIIPGALEKNVLVHYEPSVDPLHFDEPWKVRWTPENGGPYPDFSGEITIRADETYQNAVLELCGDYVPPLGLPGQVFDMAIGSRIASGTARALLQTIAGEMENRYRKEEAAKADTV